MHELEEQTKTIANANAMAEPDPEDGTFAIRVVEGPDRGNSIVFDASSRLLVGTGPACQLRLTDREVSRRHAAFEIAPGGVRVTDLESKNGTFVDRAHVFDALLEGGEVVRIGSTVLSITLESTERRNVVPVTDGFGRLIGRSLEMRRLYPLCARLARTNVPVVIEGETGTGKEVLAESLHQEGPRAAGPFVVFDCTAVPPLVVESELFGHERGAFTGAVASREGVFEQAHGGTLLIDEIGDLDMAMQAKLLRATERGEVRRVGGNQWIKVDVRIIAATRRDLDRAVAAGTFRDDLFHRLAVARIELPPLRKRRGDVEILARRIWSDLGGRPESLPAQALARWAEDPWPGNVRELRNAVARELALGDLARSAPSEPSSEATPTDASAPVVRDTIEAVLEAGLPLSEARGRVLAAFEARYLKRALRVHNGDLGRAAEASGVGRRYFQMLRAKVRG